MKQNKQTISNTHELNAILLKGEDIYQYLCENSQILPENVSMLSQKDKDRLLIYFAIIEYNIDYVKLLLENGADIHIYDDYPIQIISQYENPELMQCFLDYGANITIDNFKVVRDVYELKHMKTLNVLKSYMAKNNYKMEENLL